ncbi:hypothetical protein PSHT_03664, partial [Puccinia striiformis]
GSQLPSDFSSVKVGDLNTSSLTGGCLTVPPTDQSSTDSREVTTGPETTYPSNQAPIVNKKQLEIREDQQPSSHERSPGSGKSQAKSSSRVLSYKEMMDVCKNWLAEAEMDIMFPKKQAPTPANIRLTRYFTPSVPYIQQPSGSSCLKGLVSLQLQQTSSTPATASYPLPCSTPAPARWKLGEIQEEKDESPTTRQHCQSLGGGQRLLESRENLGENAKSSRKDEYSKQESSKSTPSPVDSYINLSYNPALIQLSDASQKEFLLSNINNRLVHDNPFLIEDKLQKLFSTFLSDSSGTIDAFPGTLLEACVEKLSSTIKSSILDLIKSEITLMLLNNILSHLRGLGGEKKSSLDICQTEPLKDLINEKVDCLQDIITINDGQQKTDMDIMRREMLEMEHRFFNNFSSITNQINDLNNNENNRFDKLKGD